MNQETLRKLIEMKMGAIAELYQPTKDTIKITRVWILMIDSIS